MKFGQARLVEHCKRADGRGMERLTIAVQSAKDFWQGAHSIGLASTRMERRGLNRNGNTRVERPEDFGQAVLGMAWRGKERRGRQWIGTDRSAGARQASRLETGEDLDGHGIPNMGPAVLGWERNPVARTANSQQRVKPLVDLRTGLARLAKQKTGTEGRGIINDLSGSVVLSERKALARNAGEWIGWANNTALIGGRFKDRTSSAWMAQERSGAATSHPVKRVKFFGEASKAADWNGLPRTGLKRQNQASREAKIYGSHRRAEVGTEKDCNALDGHGQATSARRNSRKILARRGSAWNAKQRSGME